MIVKVDGSGNVLGVGGNSYPDAAEIERRREMKRLAEERQAEETPVMRNPHGWDRKCKVKRAAGRRWIMDLVAK